MTSAGFGQQQPFGGMGRTQQQSHFASMGSQQQQQQNQFLMGRATSQGTNVIKLFFTPAIYRFA
jgi:hypothetical protein